MLSLGPWLICDMCCTPFVVTGVCQFASGGNVYADFDSFLFQSLRRYFGMMLYNCLRAFVLFWRFFVAGCPVLELAVRLREPGSA